MSEKKANYTIPFATITGLFFMWGFMTSLNDILIPYLRDVFSLSHTQAMLVQFAFFIAYSVGSAIYFLISWTTGDPFNRIGYKNGIIAGLAVSFIGALMFQPAVTYHSYTFFLLALFVLGLGFTLLQIAANPYVAILGPERTASSRLNLSQGFNSVGTVAGPALGGFLILEYFRKSAMEGTAEAVRVPYLIFAGIFLLLIVILAFAKLPRFFNKEDVVRSAGALKFPHLLFGILAIFFYVGSEVSVGSIMVSYLGLPEVAGLVKEDAAIYVSIYWFGLMTGRFIGAGTMSDLSLLNKRVLVFVIPFVFFFAVWAFIGLEQAYIYAIFMVINVLGFFIGRFLPARTVWVFALACISLLFITTFTEGQVSMWTLIATGLFNSIMWSNIFTLAIRGLGKYTSQGSSLLVMGILGGALLPPLVGMMADSYGVKYSLIILVIPYLYIAWYGFKDWQVES
jgi:MFS transporter, FHS family, L-fucose permease